MPISKVPNRPIMRSNQPIPGTGFIPASQWIDVLAIGTAAAGYTIPANVSMVRLTPEPVGEVAYGNLNGTATVPSANVTNGSGSFPIPAGLAIGVSPGQVLSVIASAAGTLSIECWQ
jgi:hypothetical protein